jgi:hypothetical protein
VALTVGQRIRFPKPSRHGDWKKDDTGKVWKVLAERPANQYDLYKIKIDKGSFVWATNEDIEPFDQMSIFDES